MYDLAKDPQEMNNIYGKAGTEKIMTELKDEIKRLQKQYNVPKELTEKPKKIHN